jgi:hypothetical protein
MHAFTYLYPEPDGQMRLRLASWEILHLEPYLEELRIITQDNSFGVIIGSAWLASFVCIPDLGICFTVSSLQDMENCRKHLAESLDEDDAQAIASGLYSYTS